MARDCGRERVSVIELFGPSMKLVLTIGVVVAIVQQITGINAVFFYAPMIFEQSGIGTDASFAQAVLVGLVNLVFTIVAIAFIDRIGRKPLLVLGLSGITVAMFVLAFGFASATYTLTDGVTPSNAATVSVTVNAVNDAPVAIDDTAATSSESYAIAARRRNSPAFFMFTGSRSSRPCVCAWKGRACHRNRPRDCHPCAAVCWSRE